MTNWRQIALLYGELGRVLPRPVVALNRPSLRDGGQPAQGLC